MLMLEGGKSPRSLTGNMVGGGGGEAVGTRVATIPFPWESGVWVGAGVSREIGVIGGYVSGEANSVGVGRTSDISELPCVLTCSADA